MLLRNPVPAYPSRYSLKAANSDPFAFNRDFVLVLDCADCAVEAMVGQIPFGLKPVVRAFRKRQEDATFFA